MNTLMNLRRIVVFSFLLLSMSSHLAVSGTAGGLLVRDSLPSDNFIKMNGGIGNFLGVVKNKEKATVAFLGGSITAGAGWRDHVQAYLQHEYPNVEFTFLNAGIPSLGSVPHSFRFSRDVFKAGAIDLVFVESAVNDLANGTPVGHQRRALEGIIRHARREQPWMDIVLMAFADEDKVKDYAAGKIPQEVQVHSDIADHYRLPFINLAKEVADRIAAGEFTWKDDFIDLHPSPFGHKLYFRTIRRMFEMGRERKTKLHKMPKPMDTFAYSRGAYVPVDAATIQRGFTINASWTPTDQAKTRKNFVNVPVLEGTTEGASLTLSFRGSAAGIAIVSGPDAGMINVSVDGGPAKTIDLYTQWSKSLHLPWYLVLADGLDNGEHKLTITLSSSKNPRATGTACRIVHFLVNGPEN